MGMTDAEFAAAAGAILVERGVMAPETVTAELAAELVDEDPHGAIDRAVFSPPADRHQYRFDALPEGITVEQQTQVDTVRGALFDAGVPVELARAADSMIFEALRDPPDDNALDRLRQEGHAALVRKHGERAAEVMRVARHEFNRIANIAPALRDAVARSGIGSSPWLVESLYHLSIARRSTTV